MSERLASDGARQKRAMRAIALGAVSTACLLLSACISFGSEPPDSLLTLKPAVSPQAGASWTGDVTGALVVQAPAVPRKLHTTRVPVQIDDANIAYLTGTAWVENPDKLMQRLLAETIAGTGARLVIDPQVAGGRQAQTLEGELVEFGVDKQAREVVIILDAVLMGDGAQVRKRRFEAREPVRKIEVGPVGEALNQVANRVALDVAEWLQ